MRGSGWRSCPSARMAAEGSTATTSWPCAVSQAASRPVPAPTSRTRPGLSGRRSPRPARPRREVQAVHQGCPRHSQTSTLAGVIKQEARLRRNGSRSHHLLFKGAVMDIFRTALPAGRRFGDEPRKCPCSASGIQAGPGDGLWPKGARRRRR